LFTVEAPISRSISLVLWPLLLIAETNKAAVSLLGVEQKKKLDRPASNGSAAAGSMRAARVQVPSHGGGARRLLPRQEGGIPEDRPRHHPGG
jgi:hypothetical protein